MLFSADVFIIGHGRGAIHQVGQFGVGNKKEKTPDEHQMNIINGMAKVIVVSILIL